MNRPQELLLSLLRAARPEIIRGQVTQPPNSVHPEHILAAGDRGLSNLAPNSLAPNSSDEWAAVAKEATRHGLSPYLFHKLRALQTTDQPDPLNTREIPASVLEDLRRAYMRNTSVNLQRFHYIGLALRALSGAGVPVIVLKGGYLAEAVYGNLALRVMCDIDVLVKPSDLPKADAALRRIDFESWEKRVEALSDTNEFHYNHKKANLLFELHAELLDSDYPFYMESEALWSAAVPARVAGVDALALSPEDLLIYQGVHAALHSYTFGLRVLVDTQEILARLPVDWDLLVARARKNNAAKLVWMLLALSRRLLDLPIPSRVLSALGPVDLASADAYLESARSAILKDERAQPAQAEGNPKVLLFFGRKGLFTKFSLVFHKAFPSWRKVAGIYGLRPNSPLVLFHYPHCLWTRVIKFAPAIRAEVAARFRKGAGAAPRKKVASLMDWLMRVD